MNRLLAVITVLLLAGCSTATPTTPTATPPPLTPQGRIEGTFDLTVNTLQGERFAVPTNYIIDLPDGYDPAADEGYPLQVFLHGAGLGGDSMEMLRLVERPPVLAESEDYPFVILFPQMSVEAGWRLMAEGIVDLVNAVAAEYHIDRSRVVITGFSDGGYGSLVVAAKYPGAFAAVASSAGYYNGDVNEVCAIAEAGVPVRLYHGTADPVIPVLDSKLVELTLRECGGEVTFLPLDGVGHPEAYPIVFNDAELYDWLLEQERGGR